MLRLAFATIALGLISACASIGPVNAGIANQPPASFDAAAAPVEAVILVVAAPLGRRRFNPPSHRQPEQWPILATAADRTRRQVRRRRRFEFARA
ncbi:MAG: hypothetical protein AB7T59_09585 [Hyphomonadaceae bacterium]